MIDKLTPRLRKAFKMIPLGTCVMDIGADRGFLSLALASSGFKTYASENKKGPFDALMNECSCYKGDNLSLIFTDGIDTLPSDVNTLVILGMGGRTIYDILSRHEDKLKQIKYLVVEPQSDMKKTISYLLDNHYENIDGMYVYERRYYPLLLFKRNEELTKVYSIEEYHYGVVPLLKKDELLKKHLDKELRRIESLSSLGKERNKEYKALLLKGLKHYE